MATVVLAVALLVVGLALVFYQGAALDIIGTVLSGDLQRQVIALITERWVAWAAMAASPLLLIVGSLLPNI